MNWQNERQEENKMDLSKLSDEELKRLAKENGIANEQEQQKPETSLGSKAETIGVRLARVATSDFADEGVAAFKTGSLPGMQESESIPEYLGGRALETLVIPGYQAVKFASKLYSKQAGLDAGDYTNERDKMREYFKKTAAANEGLDTAANIGGNALLALMPMGAIGRGASIGIAALKSGALGALQGAGESEADTASGVAKDAAIGGAISGALGGASQGLSKGLSKGFDAVKSKLMTPAAKEAIQETGEATAKLTPIEKGKSFIAQAMGVTGDDADTILRNTDKIRSLRGTTTQDAFINAVKENTKQIKQLSKQASSKLSNTRDIDSDSLLGELDNFAVKNRRIPTDMQGKPMTPQETLGVSDVYNPEREAAINDARKIIENMTKNEKNLSQKELKEGVIDQIRKQIDWNPQSANKKPDIYNIEMKRIQETFDKKLKNINTDYKEDMKKLAPLMNTQDKLGKNFGVAKDVMDESAFDKAIPKLQRLQQGTNEFKNIAEQRTLKRLDPNFVEDMRLRGVDARNEGGVTQGSRNTNLGAFTGLALKTAIGGAGGAIAGAGMDNSAYGLGAGAMLGATLDKQGRTLGKQLLMSSFGRSKAGIAATAKAANVPIEAAIRNAETPGVSKIMGFAGTPFFDRLQQAMTRGGAAYIQEDFILNNDPEYRAIKRRQQQNGTTK